MATRAASGKVLNGSGSDAVPIQDGGNSITVDGTVSVTEPVSVDDNGGSLTVDAPAATPVAVAITNTADALVKAGDAVNNAVRVNVVAGAGSGGTAQADESAFTEGTTNFTPIGGVLNETITSDPTEDQAAAVRITAKRAIHVNLRDATGAEVSVGGGTQYDEDTVSSAADKLTMAGVVRKDTAATLVDTDGDRTQLQVDASGRLHVNGSGVTQPVSGTVNIGTFPDNEPFNVAQIGGTATVNGGVAGSLAVGGHTAHDAGIAGNPQLIGVMTETPADSAPANRVSAEGDLARVAADPDGSLFVLPHGPQIWSYHVNGSAALTDASVHAAPGAGLSLYVTDIIISLGAATAINVFFEEGSTTVLGPFYLEAVNGRGLAIQFRTPKKITANTALTVTSSGAVAHSIDVQGYVGRG